MLIMRKTFQIEQKKIIYENKENLLNEKACPNLCLVVYIYIILSLDVINNQ